jgi:prolipoprotein diacylglyceryltransferase
MGMVLSAPLLLAGAVLIVLAIHSRRQEQDYVRKS